MDSAHPLRGKVFRGSKAIERGLLTRAQLRSKTWRPLFRDVYADRAIAVTHRLRCRAASRLLLPRGAVIAGRSAAHLLGVEYLGVDDPVEVIASGPFGPVKGLVIHRGSLDSADSVHNRRLTITSPLRTCWDIARWVEAADAMVFLDVLASRRLITPSAFAEYAAARAGSPGWVRAATAARLVDAGAESPQESRLRVRLVLAGLPPPVAQHVIVRDGQFLARVDLAWPALRIAVEYDGGWHASQSQLERDRDRLNRLVAEGWLVFHVTAAQMRAGLGDVTRQLRAAVRARKASQARMSG